MRLLKNTQQGITLIELVVVMLVISTLIAIGTTSLSSSAKLTAFSQLELFANDIRHAQTLAINWGCEVDLAITAGNYQLLSKTDYTAIGKSLCGNGTSIAEVSGGAAVFSVDLQNDLQFTTVGSIYFDSSGRPIDIAGSLISTTTNIDLTQGSNSWRVSINPLTGLVTYVEL